MLRRDSHALLDSTKRRHQGAWQTLAGAHRRARESVRGETAASDGSRSMRLDRNYAAMELVKAVSDAEAVVVSGESGVGKSALAVLGLTAAGDTDPDGLQALCINLRQIPRLGIEFETALGHPLSTLLGELSAPQRMLVVDGADAVAGIFAFRIAWNEFILALLLTGRSTRTLPVGAAGFITDTGVEWGRIMAMGTLIAIPPLVFTFFAARQIIAGMTAGAVKG